MNDENRDRSQADARQTEGDAKEAIGRALKDKHIEGEGIADKTEGKIDNLVDEAKAKVGDLRDRA